MSEIPVNSTFKQQNQRLVRATFKKGIINAVHVAARTVDISYAENPQTIVRNLPVSNQVDITTVMVGMRCRVDVFDETNPNDSVMAFTY